MIVRWLKPHSFIFYTYIKRIIDGFDIRQAYKLSAYQTKTLDLLKLFGLTVVNGGQSMINNGRGTEK